MVKGLDKGTIFMISCKSAKRLAKRLAVRFFQRTLCSLVSTNGGTPSSSTNNTTSLQDVL